MTKTILAIIGGALGLVVWYVTWRYSPEQRIKRAQKERDVGHKANTDKDGAALGAWWRKRSRR
ncbi:hypothetical protein LCGC14_1262580 [marine sediment metagenome]|uniref:Uncharacterized protein n=1 Tax=marine sediment metagenome TaxID=412755 RepID=A0A0F9L079_9ZZZZ